MKKRVLVVDDSRFMRIMVRDALPPADYEIVGEASNGAEGVRKYRELRPDLVTMDVTMGGQDGQEAARQILALSPGARIVMVSALGQEKMLADCIEMGVRDFVTKPFTPARLASAVQKALA